MSTFKNLLTQYRKNINPPYSRKDYPVMGLTLLVLLFAAAFVFNLPNRFRNEQTKQSEAKSGANIEDKVTSARLASEQFIAAGRALKDDSKRRDNVYARLVPIAAARKENLLSLFEKDPRIAAQVILPDDTLQTLSVLPNIAVEKKVTLEGTFSVFHRHFPDEHSEFQPQIISGSETLNLYTNGRLPNIKPGDKISLTGYKLDQKIFLKTFDSNQTVDIKPATEKVLGIATGPLNTAVIVANFSDSTSSFDIDKIRTAFQGNPGHDIVSYFAEASFGKSPIVPSFFGPYTLLSSSSNCVNSLPELQNLANNDVNYLNFRRFVYVFNCNYGASTGIGEAANLNTPDGNVPNATLIYMGYPSNMPFAYDPEIYSHELGHNMGNWHASFFNCYPQVFTPPTNFDEDTNCITSEYADVFDVMGSPPYTSSGTFPWSAKEIPHLNPYHKNNAGWFDPGKFQTVNTSGTYILTPYESTSPGVLALNIPRSNSGTSFTVEYRQPIGFDSYINTFRCANCNAALGASVRLSGYIPHGPGGGSDTEMIDNSPNSIKSTSFWGGEDLPDGALLPGNTFNDPEYGISITTVGADANQLTVQVTVPPSCTHNAPSYSFLDPIQSGSPGQTANYTVSFKNNDTSSCPSNKFKALTQETYIYSDGPIYGFSSPFKITTSPDEFTIAPGATINIIMSVTSPPNLPASNYRSQSGTGGVFVQSNQLGVPYTTITDFTYQITAPADTIPPTTPTNINAAYGAKFVNLTWETATDNIEVIGYKILVNDSNLYYTDSTSLIDPYAQPNTTRTYSIQAYDAKGNLSTPATKTITTPSQTDTSPPASPVVISSEATDRTITLRWTQSTNNTEVAGYLINSGYARLIFLPASSTSFTFDKLRTNSAFTYQVQAFDKDGNYSNFFSWPSWQTITTAYENHTAPAPPTWFFSPSGTNSQVNLEWSQVPGAASYKIYRNYRVIDQVSTTSFTDSNSSGSYFYSIKAVDATGSVSSPLPRYSVPLSYSGWKPPTGWNWFPVSGYSSSSDTTPPAVTMNGINDGQTVSGTVNINTSTSDNIAVKEVSLYLDGERFLIAQASPFGFTWDTTTTYNGAHWIYVTAYDPTANHTSTRPIFVTVQNGAISTPTPTTLPVTPTNTPVPSINTPTPTRTPTPTVVPTTVPNDQIAPTVSMTNPTNGAIVGTRSTITLSATATDNVGVTRVEFRVNNKLNCSDTTPSYTCIWKVPAPKNKSYTIQARAYDAAGNTSNSTISVKSN